MNWLTSTPMLLDKHDSKETNDYDQVSMMLSFFLFHVPKSTIWNHQWNKLCVHPIYSIPFLGDRWFNVLACWWHLTLEHCSRCASYKDLWLKSVALKTTIDSWLNFRPLWKTVQLIGMRCPGATLHDLDRSSLACLTWCRRRSSECLSCQRRFRALTRYSNPWISLIFGRRPRWRRYVTTFVVGSTWKFRRSFCASCPPNCRFGGFSFNLLCCRSADASKAMVLYIAKVR